MKFILLLLVLFSFVVSAQDIQPEKDTSPREDDPVIVLLDKHDRKLTYTHSELESHPEFTAKLLNLAIKKNDPELIGNVLDAYDDNPNADDILIHYAEAKLATLKGDHGKAVHHYKAILAQKPTLDAIRIELAMALFRDQQNANAERQFRKLQSSKHLPQTFAPMIESYLTAIEKRNEWDFDVDFNYTKDDNINNVSSDHYVGPWKKPASHLPQTAHGIRYGLSVSKDINVLGRHYVGFENYLGGYTYWDNHKYDTVSNHTSLGYRYKSPKTTVSVMPFYRRNWNNNADNDSYSTGIKTRASYWVTPTVNLAATGSYANNHYFNDDDFDGNTKSLGSTIFWRRNPEQSFYLGVNAQQRITNVKRFDSTTRSINTGWIQEWGKGVSSRIGLNYSQTKYGDKAKYGGVIPLGKIREDDTYGVNVTLWKRDWNLFGITPKLNVTWKQRDSNLPEIYSYTKQDVNISFEKSF